MPGFIRSENYEEEEEDISQYDAYLANSSIPTRASVILTFIAGLLMTVCFAGSIVYFSRTGKRVYDPDGNDNTNALLAFLGIGAALFDIAFVHLLAKYKNTYGTTALLSEAEGQWHEETQSVSSIRKPKISSIILNLFLTVIATSYFVSTVLATLRSATANGPDDGGDRNEEDPHELIIPLLVTFGLSVFLAVLTKRSYVRYRYNCQFSQEPLISGIYYGNSNTNGH